MKVKGEKKTLITNMFSRVLGEKMFLNGNEREILN